MTAPRSLGWRFATAAALLLFASTGRADVPPRPTPPAPPPPVAPAPAPAPVPSPAPAPVAPPAAKAVAPSPADAGPPSAFRLDFEPPPADPTPPEGAFAPHGRWRRVAEPGASPGNGILRQDEKVPAFGLLLFTGKGRALTDGTAKVRFRPESGEEDAAGGVVFRGQDEHEYGLARANGLEGNLRLYTVRNGFRRIVASVEIEPPKLGAWHTLEVSFVGSQVVATLDGKDRVEAEIANLSTGWCGLWTKSDSVTSFDDVVIEPARAAPPTERTPAPTGPEKSAPPSERVPKVGPR